MGQTNCHHQSELKLSKLFYLFFFSLKPARFIVQLAVKSPSVYEEDFVAASAKVCHLSSRHSNFRSDCHSCNHKLPTKGFIQGRWFVND